MSHDAPPNESSEKMPSLTGVQWLICVIAAIGFAFDIYELLMLPLIARPALLELLQITDPNDPRIELWVGRLFYYPAVFGGIFGLIGGYLTDRLGRRRVLVWSILLYAFSAMAAGFSTSVEMLLVLRCTTFIGVCVEFVAAVAWLAELFPNPKQRETVLGYTQAFSSVGGLLVTGAYFLSVQFGEYFPAIHGGHEAWRYTLISGVIPAIPLIVIRPFLPESPAWADKKAAGTLQRPSFAELFQPALRKTTIVTAIMFACSYGAAFGAIQHAPRIVPALLQAQSPPAAEAAPADPADAKSIEAAKRRRQQTAVSQVQAYQEIGGLLGRFALAFLAVRIVSRRSLLRIFQIPGLFILPLIFLTPVFSETRSFDLFKWGLFFCGFLTVAQFSFWGNYLPRVYPMHLRGTGESFAANIGGRLIGTSAAWVTTNLAVGLVRFVPDMSQPMRLALAATAVGASVYLIGTIACFWLPEPAHEELPD